MHVIGTCCATVAFSLQSPDQTNLGDFLSLELIEGVLVLRYDTGAGVGEARVGMGLSDGTNHSVEIATAGNRAEIILDELVCQGTCFGTAESDPRFTILNVMNTIYLGGLNATTLPSSVHLVSGASFVGVVQDLSINLQPTDLAPFASLGHRNVQVGSDRVEQCNPSACENGGVCRDLWFSYECSCPVGFVGINCDRQNLANFAGDSFLRVAATDGLEMSTIRFAFSTQNQNGILVYTANVSLQLLFCIFPLPS